MDAQLLRHIALAALEAGQKILEIYDRDEITVTLKADASPLTMADEASHALITQYLEQTPYPVLSEESKSVPYGVRNQWTTYWLVDPLDGTKEFIKRNGEFTVNIALIHHGVPVAGVVYAPVKQWLYLSAEGKGVWKLETQNHTLPTNWQDQAQLLPINIADRKYTVVGSRSHASGETDAFIAQLEREHGEVTFVSMGSSLKICLVAEGKADIYPRLAPTMEWDTAAGDAIARCAGCQVVQFGTKEPLQYNKQDLLNPWFVVQR